MAAPAMQAIANITLSAASATVTFSNIPQTYRDLVLVCNVIADTAGDDIMLRLNSDITNGNYARVLMSGNGASTYSVTGASQDMPRITYYGSSSTSERSSHKTEIFDYATTDKHKTYLTRSNRAGSGTDAVATRWASTAAVTTLSLNNAVSGGFGATSTFTLYGVLA